MCGSNSIPLYKWRSFSSFFSPKTPKNSAEMKWKYGFAKPAHVGKNGIEGPLRFFESKTLLNCFSLCLELISEVL